jgi:DNA-binding winged helix-turn-helix (wHTH) protein
MAMRLAFGPWAIDPQARRLSRDDAAVPISDRWMGVLLRLIASPGEIISKDDLIAAGWPDVAVADNSLEQAVSGLRRLLGAACIETMPGNH